ncbi:perforin-1-like [Brienomyrus brachyistius]|uniref:perforin-1-like n=1 Tax=Brienomyrus brachyistius TaxID=42636 RepID=UPI0020B2BFBF|nr:perforin-1-like [Brienomyrus brachyistius]
MEGLWRLLVLGWLCHLQSPGVLGVMAIGTPEECEKAPFVPGYNLGGEGFDIVKMERKGAYVIDSEQWRNANGTCKLRRNPYLKGPRQKIPIAVVNWRAISKCRMKVSSTVYESSESVVNDSTSSVTNNWKAGLEIPVNPNVKVGVGLGGTHSRDATFAMTKSKQDKYSFTKHQVHCSLYSYSVAIKPPLHKEFLEFINQLPKQYNQNTKTNYRDLIDTYGTHFIKKVETGGKLKSITAIKTCQTAMSGLTDTAVKDCLDVEASATTAMTASIKTEAHHCKELKKKLGSSQTFSSMFSERHSEVVGGNVNSADLLFSGGSDPSTYKSWLDSLKNSPDVVSYSLKPLHFLLPSGHFAIMSVKKAIEQYIIENALLKSCSESCQIGIRSSARDHCACVCNGNGNINSNCCPISKGLATLKVYKMRAKKLYGDHFTKTDGSVLVSYGRQRQRTKIIPDNDNPVWQENFEFGAIKVDMSTKLTFQVYDEDTTWNSDLLGKCSFDLQRGTVSDTCMFTYGTFFFSYTLTCAPSLGGSTCSGYKPTPMSVSQAKIFDSRNGILARNLWKVEKAGKQPGNHSIIL